MPKRVNAPYRKREGVLNVQHRGHQEPVLVNIYDISWINDITSSVGLGIYHSGVEVYGIEYGFGGHPYESSGIFEIPSRRFSDMCEDFNYKECIVLGYTEYTRNEVRRIIKELGSTFRGNSYHLMKNNCNHFSNALSNKLCNKSIPAYVNRLAKFGCIVPFLQRCMPQDWLTPHTRLERCHRRAQQQRQNRRSHSPR